MTALCSWRAENPRRAKSAPLEPMPEFHGPARADGEARERSAPSSSQLALREWRRGRSRGRDPRQRSSTSTRTCSTCVWWIRRRSLPRLMYMCVRALKAGPRTTTCHTTIMHCHSAAAGTLGSATGKLCVRVAGCSLVLGIGQHLKLALHPLPRLPLPLPHRCRPPRQESAPEPCTPRGLPRHRACSR
ncbi:unnamed protein product [Prorocentrum cordatum]|uniref:Uncharacterized protein n=1 Tax=Prorocentrum cordatum TaxID=2364126 RepID=A0ABN9PVN4_9DINO|nr:unnamed protein product [Polarella glacialis]